MNEQIKKEWVAALRSGAYKKTSSVLFDGKNYCALGVLCSLYMQYNPEKARWVKTAGGYKFETKEYCQWQGSLVGQLPKAVTTWAGLDTSNPIFLKRNESKCTSTQSISEMNDSGKSFQQIADAIEFGRKV